MISMVLAGCGGKSQEEQTNEPESALAPPQAQAAQSAPQQRDLTNEYKKIQEAIYLLKQNDDPNLNQLIDLIESAGSDGNIDEGEVTVILSNIEAHMQALAQNQSQATPSSSTGKTLDDLSEEEKADISKNPNPFS